SPNEILFTDEGRSNGQNQGLHRWNGVSSSKINNYCTEGLAIGDLNNDGQIDLACTRGYYRGPGNVVFQLKIGNNWSSLYNVTNNPGYYHGIAIGDMNNDGRKDIVFTDDSFDVVRVFANNGGNPPTFTQIAIISVNSNLRGSEVTLYDLDCDGDYDIVWAKGSVPYGATIGWLENMYPNNAWTNHIIENGTYSNYGVAVGCVNQDKRPDIIAGLDGSLYVWYNTSLASNTSQHT
ncbi:MAG: VCBS repeat-containing protein, partial [candidate division WOR-3 bacterium]